MNKRKFIAPYIVLSGISSGGDDNVIGGGTGQGSSNPFPMSYNDWLNNNWATDYNGDGADFQDFITWWVDNDFSEDDWNQYNGDTPWGSGDWDWEP